MPTQLEDEQRIAERITKDLEVKNAIQLPVKSSERPPKDVWDKMTAIGPIISGLITLAVGGYFTYVFNEHQLRLLEIQTIEKFIPRLAGDEQSKRAAILAISTLTSTELASKMAGIYASSGTASALESIAENGNEKDKQIATKALAATLEKITDNQTRLTDIEKIFKDEIQKADSNKDTSPGELAGSLDKLAETYLVQGQYALAEPLFQRSLALRQQAFGNDSSEVRKSLKALADLYRLKGDNKNYENYLNLAQVKDKKETAQQNTEPVKTQPEPKAAEPTISESVIDKASTTEIKISEKKETASSAAADSAPHPN
jgi:Tetratricopeptide repeat